jgi:hypothetical protein
MPAPSVEAVLPYLLPFDPEVVADDLGTSAPVLPGVRCTEDRPRADQSVDFDDELGGLVVRQLATKTPSTPEPSELWTADGMWRSAQRTGLSFTGGLASVPMALTISRLMRGERPSIGIDGQTAHLAREQPGFGEIHEHCVGRAQMLAILRAAVTDPDATLGRALQTAPWVEQRQLGPFVDAAATMVDQYPGLFPASGIVTPIPMRRLAPAHEGTADPPQHAAEIVVAINGLRGRSVLWDTAQAWKDGLPGYALNTAFVPQAMERAARTIGGDPELATAALLFFQGAAIDQLPHPQGGKLDVVYVDATSPPPVN